MVTLISNPLGHKLSDSEIDAVIIDNGTGDALVYMATGHALTDGDYVYIQSNIESYNGYKYVDSIAYDSFKIRDSENSDAVEYVKDADITYRVSVLEHGWQCVHLPIVYEIESDISPTNIAEEAYTPVTIISQSDEGGLTRLALSVGLDDPLALDKIKLFGSGSLEGVYQIVTVYQDWNIVIDLPYDSTNSFTGLQVIKWYDNYTINVRVWAGLSSDHRWESNFPRELAATLQFVPDDNNRIKFSIAEVLKSYIRLRNNLTLDTLPNNLDFMVSFYIQYFETYDVSDGEEVTTYTGIINTDAFIGYAVNAKLPFKSEEISFLSQYIDEDVYYAKWLTLQDRPIFVIGRFFDLSFINQYNTRDVIVYFERFLNGSLVSTETVTYTNPGQGVMRIPVTAESGVDEVCLVAHVGEGTEIVPANVFDLEDFLNYETGGHDWALGVNPSWDTSEMDILNIPFFAPNAVPITFHYSFYVNSIVGSVSMVFRLASTSPVGTADSNSILINAPGLYSGDLIITPTANRDYFTVNFSITGITTDGYLISIGYGAESTVITPGFQVTERICLDVIEECDSTFIPDEVDDARLLEDGNFRLLE